MPKASHAKTVTRRGPRGGFGLGGTAKNDKRLEVGEITGTYVSTGLAVNKLGGPAAFGLVTLDVLKLEPTIIAAAYSDAELLFHASYDVTNQKIFLLEDIGAAYPAYPSVDDAIVIRFVAVGDDATAPELS